MPSTAYARKAEDSATWQAGSHRRQTVDALVNALHRLAADGYEDFATPNPAKLPLGKLRSHRRQTVDALLNAFHRLAADGYENFATSNRPNCQAALSN